MAALVQFPDRRLPLTMRMVTMESLHLLHAELAKRHLKCKSADLGEIQSDITLRRAHSLSLFTNADLFRSIDDFSKNCLFSAMEELSLKIDEGDAKVVTFYSMELPLNPYLAASERVSSQDMGALRLVRAYDIALDATVTRFDILYSLGR